MAMSIQRENIEEGVKSFVSVVRNNTCTIVHGNGPQVGLLALEDAAYQKQQQQLASAQTEPIALDILDAETEGMIGYQIEQELSQQLADRKRGMVTVLSQIVVDKSDPAFANPTKFIGPIYTQDEADALPPGMTLKKDGDYYRRVVPSPLPVRLIDQQLEAVKLLTSNNCVVICAGGGGIPVVEDAESRRLVGVEAVIDKDRAAAMLGTSLGAHGLLILTDVGGVATGFGTADERWIRSASPERLRDLMEHFPDGSMGPKVGSVIDFVQRGGRWGKIGSLHEANKIVDGSAGLVVTSKNGQDHLEYY